MAAGTLSSVASAQPMPVERRSYGVLAADTQLDAIVLLRDLTGDGDALDAGESSVFFDASNASNIPNPTGSVFVITQAADGSIYFGDGDTDAVYRLRDFNRDGDALDAGEAQVWYASQAGLEIPSPNGIAFDAAGAVYILTAGTASFPDRVIRTIDVDGDGSATGVGEASMWLDTAALVPATSAFEMSFVGDVAFFADLRGNQSDAIMRAFDANADGVIGGDEVTVFIDDTNTFGVPCSFSCISDGVSVFTHESTASVNPQRVVRLTDLNNNGFVESGETRELWNETLVPAGSVLSNSFSIAIGASGRFAISSNGTDAQDNIFLMRDLDGSGDFLQAGETSTFVVGGGAGIFPENARALSFIAGYCSVDWNADGVANSQDLFDFLVDFFAGDADFNQDAVTNSQDFFDFLAAFFAGC